MAEKKYSGAPFGTQTARFDVTGVHPKTKVPGSFTQMPYDKFSMMEKDQKQKLIQNSISKKESSLLGEVEFTKLERFDSLLNNVRRSLNEVREINQDIQSMQHRSQTKQRPISAPSDQMITQQKMKQRQKMECSNKKENVNHKIQDKECNKKIPSNPNKTTDSNESNDCKPQALRHQNTNESSTNTSNTLEIKQPHQKKVSVHKDYITDKDSVFSKTSRSSRSKSIHYEEMSNRTSFLLKSTSSREDLYRLMQAARTSNENSMPYADITDLTTIDLKTAEILLRMEDFSLLEESYKSPRERREEIMKDEKQEVKRKLGPGSYNTMNGGFSATSVDLRASGPGWARQLEVERLAALPHLLHKEQWEENKMLKRKLGPGSYEIKDFIQSGDLKPRSERGICQKLAPRFEKGFQSITPGPGTYGIGGVPKRALEEKAKVSASTKGMLDAGDRKRNLPSVGSQLGPGTYKHKTCTDEMINKVTSLRGPYELYSGDRNKPITEGYLAAPKLADLGPGQYEIGSFVDEWKGHHKNMHGKFGKLSQYPEVPTDRIFLFSSAHYPKMKDSPGPGAYSSQELSKPRHLNSPGFLSSAKRDDKMSQKFFTQNFNPVGAGRYDIQKFEEAQDINGHTSVFKSKSGKPNLQMGKFLQERIRAKDVCKEDRVFIQAPDRPALSRSITVM